MDCDKSFDSGQQQVYFGDMIGGVSFDDLCANDNILIKTKNSLYCFSVSNPARREGQLSGGTLGDSPRSAVLIESLIAETSGIIGNPTVLKVGARALFYLTSARGIERVMTSAILDITVLKEDGGPSLVS